MSGNENDCPICYRNPCERPPLAKAPMGQIIPYVQGFMNEAKAALGEK